MGSIPVRVTKNGTSEMMSRKYFGDLAQLVRAFASHARGHGFESPSLHHRKDIFRKKDVFFCFDRQFRERILSMMNKMIAVSLLIA